MTAITNNKLPEWRKALNKAVENYQSAQAWHEENQDSPSAQQNMEEAEGGIKKLIRQYGVLIVLNLLDKIDELQELRRNYLALRGEIEDVRSQLYEAENQANEYASELQERRKAAAEPVLYVMGMGCAFDAETASTCKGAVDSWVGEWNQERLPGQEEYKTVPLYTVPPVQETGVYKDMLNIIGLLENNEWDEHCASTVLGSLLESEITRLVGKEQPVPVVPVGLRMALSNAGIAAPESDEMLAATHEKYIQALVTWVKDRKPFQPAQVVPEEVMPGGLVYSTAQPEFESKDSDKVVGYYCFISGKTQVVESQEQAYADAKSVINACRNAMLNGDTFRENSISSTNNFREIEETSTNSPVIPDGSEDTKRLDWLDAQNKRLNEYYGTSYGWKFDANFQRNAMMLNDSNYPVMTVRQAIDKAIAAAPQQETNN